MVARNKAPKPSVGIRRKTPSEERAALPYLVMYKCALLKRREQNFSKEKEDMAMKWKKLIKIRRV